MFDQPCQDTKNGKKVFLNNLGNIEISEFYNAGFKHLYLVLFIVEDAAAW